MEVNDAIGTLPYMPTEKMLTKKRNRKKLSKKKTSKGWRALKEKLDVLSYEYEKKDRELRQSEQLLEFKMNIIEQRLHESSTVFDRYVVCVVSFSPRSRFPVV